MGSSHHQRHADASSGGSTTLQTIGAFAAAVGLSQSALREYGSRGLLAPAEVEEHSGYRYYAPQQQQRAIWIRRLRDAGMRLDAVRTILDGDQDEADAVLDAWIADFDDRSASARQLASDLRLAMRARAARNPVLRTSASMDAAVLRSAVDQVAGIVDVSDVLIELEEQSVGVVALDRYVLAARTRLPAVVRGAPARMSTTAAALTKWLQDRSCIELIAEARLGRESGSRPQTVWLRDGAGCRFEPESALDLFPDAHRIIEAAEDAHSIRVAFRRADLLAVSTAAEAPVRFQYRDGAPRAAAGRDHARGRAHGVFPAFSMSAPALRRIAASAVGDELAFEIGEPGRPMLWRAPSQPDFVVLMVPSFA